MKKVDKPDWSATDNWDETAARGFLQATIDQTIDAINSVIDEVKGNRRWTDLNREAINWQGGRLTELDGIQRDGDEGFNLIGRIEALGGEIERQVKLHAHNIPNGQTSWGMPIKAEAPDTPPLGTDCDVEGMKQEGSWVCQECGKDWGLLIADGYCPKCKSKIGVKWIPSPDTDKPQGSWVCENCSEVHDWGKALNIDVGTCDACGADAVKWIPDTDKPQGSWVCQECGKDWGQGFDGIRKDGVYLCPKYEGGCDKVAVKWTPAPDTDKPLHYVEHEGVPEGGEGMGSIQPEAPDELKPTQYPKAINDVLNVYNEIERLKAELDDTSYREDNLAKVVDELKDKYEKRDLDVADKDAEIDRLKADYAKLDECYTIMQKINAEIDPRDVVAENDELKAENATLKGRVKHWKARCDSGWEQDKALRAEISTLKDENERLKGEVKKWQRIRKPTHGECCTCQKCGQYYDDCRCDLDEVADELGQAQETIKLVRGLLQETFGYFDNRPPCLDVGKDVVVKKITKILDAIKGEPR